LLMIVVRISLRRAQIVPELRKYSGLPPKC
jgi:hypothetical protein